MPILKDNLINPCGLINCIYSLLYIFTLKIVQLLIFFKNVYGYTGGKLEQLFNFR